MVLHLVPAAVLVRARLRDAEGAFSRYDLGRGTIA